MKILESILVVLAIAVVGCTPKATSTSSSSTTGGKYSEDLSVWRPKPVVDSSQNVGNSSTSASTDPKKKTDFVEAKYTVNEQLDYVLDSITEVNLINNHVDGFTIQIYSGVRREEALNVKKELGLQIPELDAEIQYVQPNFRVRAGKYFDRYEAQKDYMTIKRHFPNAIILPERIPIR